MLIQIYNYTFNAAAKTVTFTDYVTISLLGVKSIKNITTADTIYLPGNSFIATVLTNVLTFTSSNIGMNNTDVLEIFYDDPLATPGNPITIPNPLDANVVGPVGQQTMANSLPVTIASDQTSIPISGTVTVDTSLLATAAKQDTQITSLSSIDAKLPSGLVVTLGRLQVELPAGGGGLTDAELRATPVSISVASLPLPTGASTSALQTTGNTSLGNIDTKLPSGLTVTGSRLQVELPAGGGGLTDAELRATPVPISATNLDTRDLTFAADKVDVSGSTGVGVTGTFWQATQPVSAASLPLPTGAAIASNQQTDALTDVELRATPVAISGTITANAGTNLNTSALALESGGNLAALVAKNFATETTLITLLTTSAFQARVNTLGQKTMANSTPVVLASDQTVIPISDNSSSISVDWNGTQPVTGSGNATGALRVELPTNGTGVVGLNTGSNIVGRVGIDQTTPGTTNAVQDIPATSGGLSKFHLVGAASTNATNIKASAGQVYTITAFNLNASPRYLKFHNTAGTPTAGSGVTDTYLIPGNASGTGLVLNIDKGITFGTGIGITITTGIADADTGAISASEVVVNIYYK